MKTGLKPCPFCGETNIIIANSPSINGCKGAECKRCGANIGYFSPLSHGLDAWNTRPIEDALQAKIDALEVKAKALDLLVEMAKASQVVRISADAEVIFVENHPWYKPKIEDDFYYSTDLCDAIAAAYTAWKEGEE